MNIEQQVCSLELAKKLKELGVKQDSIIYWYNYSWNGWIVNTRGQLPYNLDTEQDDCVSAFTVAELGEMLPPYIEKYEKTYWRNFNIKFMSYMTRDGNYDDLCPTQGGDTEADTRAKMLIHLIENNLVKVEDLIK